MERNFTAPDKKPVERPALGFEPGVSHSGGAVAKMIVAKDFTFEASHVLPRHPGKCSRLHGHSWQLRVEVIGRVSVETGFVCDFGDLKTCVMDSVVHNLDHTHLGWGRVSAFLDGAYTRAFDDYQCYLGKDFYPTSENLCIAIARILQPLIPELKGAPQLYAVTIKETCTSAARWINPGVEVTACSALA